MSFFLYLAKTKPFFSYVDSQLFIKHSTKVKMEKNDETVISLSVPPTVFQLQNHTTNTMTLKRRVIVLSCVKKRCIKEINRRIQKEKHEVHWSFI